MATPVILYDNVLKTWPAATESATSTAPYAVQNITDGRDFSVYRHNEGATTTVEYNITEAKAVDAWGIFTKNQGYLTPPVIALSYRRGGSTTTIDTFSNAANALKLRKFSTVNLQSGDVVILTFTGGIMDIRQIYVGKYLEPPQGQYQSMTNPNEEQGIKINTTISRTGDVLDRTVTRTERTGSLEISHVTESWYRTYWEPFAVHAQRRSFFYLPDPLVDDDAVFSTASAVVPGQPMGIGDLFSVKWKLSSVAKDSLYAL